MNLPGNSTYQYTPSTPAVPTGPTGGFNYVPKTNKYQYSPTPAPTADVQAAMSQYGQLKNLQPETPFLPPTGDIQAPIPIPSDYSGFVTPGSITNNGQNLSWGTPTAPVIRNLPGDVPGQYVQDTTNPDLLVKSIRGSSPIEDQSIRNGRPGSLYQIDHIIPLELGGADTMANRELLTVDQNNQKNIAQSVPYTLYAHGAISLSDARTMAMQWKNRDIGGLSVPDNVGMIPLKQAQDAMAKWALPPAPTFKDTMAAIPETMKDLGKGFIPDSVRSFIKGAASGLTFGFLPDVPDGNETTFDKAAGFVGGVAGGFASFFLGGAVLGAAGKGLQLTGRLFGALKGTASAAATAEGLTSTAETIAAGRGFISDIATPKLGFGERLAQAWKTPIAKVSTELPTDRPAYLWKGMVSPLTANTLKGAGKFAATSVFVGQMNQLVQNQLNPYTLSGQQLATDQKNLIPRIIGDAVLGGVAGVASPTLKGAALAMSPVLMIDYMNDPYHPMNAFTNAAIFGAMHLVGSGAKKTDMANLKQSFEDAKSNPSVVAYTYNADRMAHNQLGYYAPKLFPDLKTGEAIPTSSYTPENIAAGTKAYKDALDLRMYGGTNPDGSPAQFGMNPKAYAAELVKMQVATSRLARMNLSPEAQASMGVDDIISIAKAMKKGKGKPVNPNILAPELTPNKSHLDTLWEKFTPTTAKDVANWQLANKDAINTGNANAPQLTDTAPVGVVFNQQGREASIFYGKDIPGQDRLPYVTGYLMPQMEGVVRQGNAWRAAHPNPSPKFVSEQDLHPENYIQLVGHTRDQKTGAITDYDLGVLPGPERLTNINKETDNWKVKPPDIQSTKDDFAAEMDKRGVDKMLFQVDWSRSTPETIKSGYPFGVLKTTEQSWKDTMAMDASLKASGIQSPYSKHISDIRNSQNADTVSTALTVMTNKAKTDVTEAASPQELEASLNKPTMGPPIGKQDAADIFSVKDEPVVKQNLEKLVAAENSGNGKAVMQAKTDVMAAMAVTKLKYSGMEDYPLTPTTVQLDLPNSSRIIEPVPVSKITNTREPSTPSTSIADGIVTNAQRELPSKKGFSMSVGGKTYDFNPRETAYIRTDPTTRKFYKLNPDNTESLTTPPKGNTEGAGSFEGKIEPMTEEVKRVLADVPGGNTEDLARSTQAMREMGLIPSQESIPVPKAHVSEIYRNFDESIKSKKPAVQFTGEAWDKAFSDMFGPKYRDSPKASAIIEEIFGPNGPFLNFKNNEGREIQHTPAYAEKIAAGDWEGSKKAVKERAAELAANPTGSGGNLTEAELQNLGVTPGEGDFAGMTVRPGHQEGLLGDFSRGESLMLPIFGSEGPVTGKQAVRAIRTLFLGRGKRGTPSYEPGLKDFILERYPNAGRSIALDQLERDATAADAIQANRERVMSNKFAKAKDLLASLKKEEESVKKTIVPADERPKWQTPELVKSLEENLKTIKERIAKGEKFLEEAKPDGAGGPGIPAASMDKYGGSVGYSGVVKAIKGPSRAGDNRIDGSGGPGDFLGSIGDMWSNLTGPKQNPITITDVPQPVKPTSYNVRGIPVTDSDLGEAANILYGEISNRPADKQQFEIRHILNTAINRANVDPKTWGSTLTQVLQKPYQYQSYAPQGIAGPGGKTIESQYQKAMAGDVDPAKMKTIRDTLNELKTGSFPDTTGGSTFYVHASDGTIWLGKTPKEAKTYANQHERQSGSTKTQWGTAIGAPVQTSPLAMKTLGK